MIVVPSDLVAPSVALFMFIITLIGGNFPVLIPLFESLVGFDRSVSVEFTAAGYCGSATEGQTVSFTVENSDASKLQYSLALVMTLSYFLAGALYLVAAYQFYSHGRKAEKVLLTTAS